MTFPHYFHFFGHQVHPHLLMELIAYPTGFHLWLWLRRRPPLVHLPIGENSQQENLDRKASERSKGPGVGPESPHATTPAYNLPIELGLWITAGAILGAAAGSKLLAWIEDWPIYLQHATDYHAWIGGKTIVGGLLGGWVGVEIIKKIHGVRGSTGDAYVYPLILAISIGRVGCFLTGLADKTCGSPTTLPWAIDFGDHTPRHPTQLYEIAFLLLLGTIFAIPDWVRRAQTGCHGLAKSLNPSHPIPGRRFRWFILSYLTFRFLIEFLKPVYAPYLGLSAIQLACVFGIFACVRGLMRLAKQEAQSSRGSKPQPKSPNPTDPLISDPLISDF